MKIFFLLLLLFASFLNAQVGINTTNPSSTLHIEGNPTNSSILDGLIIPRLTGDQLQTKNYTTSQNGALVYITSPSSLPIGQTSLVQSSGMYCFNSTLNKWIKISPNNNTPNVYCNNNDPNIATIFDDDLPVVTNDNTLKQNDEYTYYGLDGSTWLWNGTLYTSYNINANLSTGQRLSVYKTMSNSAANGTHLPASGLIELDGLVRIGLNKYDNIFYKPYIQNISSNTIKITFASGFRGATTENRYAVQASILTGGIQGIDNNDITYWTTGITEVLTADIILPNGKWYEIQWLAYELNLTKHIYMSAVRKF